MTDLLRKPAIGTAARAKYAAAQRQARKPCTCGSGLKRSPFAAGKCLACNPETAERYARMRGNPEKATQ